MISLAVPAHFLTDTVAAVMRAHPPRSRTVLAQLSAAGSAR
ncbi:hypothetical protein MBLL_04741 (plasmid) [Methylobacterium bullatum]|uniref:Uncharacterized protein n=1 Tax=Methylobacterium bullatum TaxID=570505 RepID=A0A679KBT2_9HYPH|nr:hypothetical protein MBLL_04741 [Methylobacterium bullatum]